MNLRYEQAVVIAQQWEAEAKRFKAWAEQWQAYQLAQLPDPNSAVIQQLQSQLTDSEQQLQFGWQCFEQQRRTLEETSANLETANQRIQQLSYELSEANRQLQTSSSKELVIFPNRESNFEWSII